MTAVMTHDPHPDGGYPLDRDLHQMSDDGGPVGPDPARWADPAWRDAAEPPPRFVFLDRDSGHIRLSAPGAATVVLGPYHNPALARSKAAALCKLLAAARAAKP